MNKKLAFPSLPLSGAHCSVYLGILRQQTQMIAADKERREKIGVVGRRGEANLLLGKSGINYKHHAIDSQGRLGDVCWHDNLWKWEQMGSEMIHPGCLEGLTRPQTPVLDPVSKNIFHVVIMYFSKSIMTCNHSNTENWTTFRSFLLLTFENKVRNYICWLSKYSEVLLCNQKVQFFLTVEQFRNHSNSWARVRGETNECRDQLCFNLKTIPWCEPVDWRSL